MADLNSLNSKLSYWNGQVSSLDSKIKKSKNRKKDIEDIIKALERCASNDSSDINSQLDKCSSELGDAIEYSGKGGLYSKFSGKRDYGKTDTNVQSAIAELRQELSTTEDSIQSCEGDLRHAKDMVKSYKNQIADEKERQLAEKVKNALNID